MLLKIGLTLLVIFIVWTFFIRAKPTIGRKPARRIPKVETLGRCERCGTYRVYGKGCDCPDDADRSTGGPF